MRIELIRVDGQRQSCHINRVGAINTIAALIGADCTDTVNLRDGRAMIVNDRGYKTELIQTAHHFKLNPVAALLPVNEEATKIYHAVCVPGTTHQIVGDVVIANDADFAD
jgi:hypothetical protein